jgi:uncharacterized repeat protein (TIGR01451 family)
VATVTIELVDSGPGTAPDVNTSPTQDFDISVTAQPDTPSSDAIADQAVDELTLLSFTATATDPDVPETLTFTLEDGIDPVPAGALITAGGLFTWTPTEAQGQAVYNFVVRVTDSTARTDTTTVQITVDEVNVAPSLVDPGAQTDTEGVPVVLAMVGTDPDLPANPLSYTASGLPPGLSINSVTGVISGTPTFSASAGSPYSVDVTVTDSLGESDMVTFSWTINDAGSGIDIVKTSDAGGSVLPGEKIKYTITVTNNDSVTHTGVLVNDQLPSGTTYVAVPGTEVTAPASAPFSFRDEFCLGPATGPKSARPPTRSQGIGRYCRTVPSPRTDCAYLALSEGVRSASPTSLPTALPI